MENFLERLSVYLSTLVSFDILKQMEDLFQMVGIEFPFDEYTKFFRKYKNIQRKIFQMDGKESPFEEYTKISLRILVS